MRALWYVCMYVCADAYVCLIIHQVATLQRAHIKGCMHVHIHAYTQEVYVCMYVCVLACMHTIIIHAHMNHELKKYMHVCVLMHICT